MIQIHLQLQLGTFQKMQSRSQENWATYLLSYWGDCWNVLRQLSPAQRTHNPGEVAVDESEQRNKKTRKSIFSERIAGKCERHMTETDRSSLGVRETKIYRNPKLTKIIWEENEKLIGCLQIERCGRDSILLAETNLWG